MNVKTKKLNALFVREINNIVMFDVKDPNLNLVSVTEVEVTNDLSMAKVYVSIINQKNRSHSLEALKKAKGFIKSELAKRMTIRKIPDLVFIYDDTLDKAQRIENIINKINMGE